MFESVTPTARRPRRPTWKNLLLCSVALLPMVGSAAQAEDDPLRLMSLNIWNKFKNNPEYASDFFIGGDWDALLFQEENGSRYVQNIPGILAGAGLGTYQGARNGSSGIISRLPGTTGTYSATGAGAQGRNITYALANADGGRPGTYIASVHLDSGDQPTQRINEAIHLTNWSKTRGGPLILAGDFNAGDVSERGLHSKAQQEFFLRLYTKNPTNNFYYSLLSQYAKDKTVLDKFIADWRGKGNSAINAAPISPDLFADETYAIAGNTPRTMNLLKKQFIALQTEAEREDFFPHELNDGSTTWPSAGEDSENVWGSWHRVKIDHFLASRPFGKWYAIADDPDDPYLGVIKDVNATTPGGQTPLSDHEPVAHEFRWVGPKLETYSENVGGTVVSKTRIVWADDATTFAEKDKDFLLTRNNRRTDVYLGQVADTNGNPILTALTEQEKKTLLDCMSTDPRFQQAIVDYCIDDHSFIGETLVSDGGTVTVYEDVALGSGSADLRLDGGGLRVIGTGMTTLARDVSLENDGGSIEIAEADAVVTASGVISGTGDFDKSGDGRLVLSGTSTYNGATKVSEGVLSVNGSIATSSLTTVADGGTLGGTGTVGNLMVASGGVLSPGNSIGTLNVSGDLTFSSGAILDYELGSGTAGNPAAGISDRINVTGDLAMNGTLNLSQSGDPSDGTAGFGYYRLMTYGGALSGGGLTIGGTPTLAYSVAFEIQAGSGNVDLFIGALGDDTLQHWQGGDGVWGATDEQWLNRNGESLVAWAGNHAIFKNQPGGFNGGTIAIEGPQSFKGLQIVDEGYRLEGDGALRTATGGSEVRILADSAEIATRITGTGGIVKTQAGKLILSGENTYQGGTTVLGGTVQVASDANLGAVSGGLALTSGTLTATSSFDSSRMVTLSGSGAFNVADGRILGLTGTVGGAGNLIKRGDGTLYLSGQNAYGNTVVEAGTLSGNSSSISGDIANAGTVVFDQALDSTFDSNIIDHDGKAGTMVKLGAGKMTLEGTSTLDWTINQGGVTTAAERFTGDIAIGADGAFGFAQAANAVYAGVVSGQGSFTIAGNGGVLLTGDSAGFAGLTKVDGGTLLVGDASGKGALGGRVEVSKGATLGGSGTIGSGAGSQVAIASGGTLSPGNSIGLLTVHGDLVFEAGSRFAVEVNPKGGKTDLVEVTGTAALNSGSVAHIGTNGTYNLRSTHTILSAGDLTGAFDGVTSNFAFLTPDLLYDYDLGTVDFKFARNDRDFASVAQTRNQSATARGIESIGIETGHEVYDAIALLPDDAHLIRGSFDQLSGEIHASAKSALIEDSRFVRDAASGRIRAAFGGVGAPTVPVLAYGPDGAQLSDPDKAQDFVAWGHAFGSWGSFDGNGNAAGLDTSTGGLLFGADASVFDHWRLGLLAGYSHISLDAGDRTSSGSSDNYHLGLYGGTQWGQLGFRSGLAYTWHRMETGRSIAFPGFSDTLSGDYDAGTFQAFGELGYRIDTAAASLEPFANLAYVNLHTDGFMEDGGSAALHASGQSTDTTFTTLGLRASTDFALAGMQAKARGMAGWRHAFGDTTPLSTHAFTGSDAFTVAGAPIAKDAAVIEAGLDLNLTDSTTLGVAYQGQFGDGVQHNGFNAKLQVKF